VFGDGELERQDRVVLEFDAPAAQESEFMLSFASKGSSYEVYSLRKKAYLVGSPSSANLEEATACALKAWGDFAKQHALLPSL
jgi:hypothetical protein